jgi:predicted RNA binding protein YcfA (HicA-like mRNA interferase family)
MKGREFIRRLRRAGAIVIPHRGKGGHMLVEYQGKRTTVPFHGNLDLDPVFLKEICKQLGLDPQGIM